MSGATDPYQPLKKNHQITRQCMEILVQPNWPIIAQTRSPLVVRVSISSSSQRESKLASRSPPQTTRSGKPSNRMNYRHTDAVYRQHGWQGNNTDEYFDQVKSRMLDAPNSVSSVGLPISCSEPAKGILRFARPPRESKRVRFSPQVVLTP